MSTVSHTVEYQTLIKREEESVYMQLEKDSKIYYYVKKVTRCSAVCLICSLLCKYFGLGYVYWYWEKIILEGYWKNVLTMVYPEERNWRGREIVFILHFFYLNLWIGICLRKLKEDLRCKKRNLCYLFPFTSTQAVALVTQIASH